MNLPGSSWSGRKGGSPVMALYHPPGGEGQRPSHLRSIGSWAPVPGVRQLIHFSKAVTLFGRNVRVVDYCLTSPAATPTDLNYISRIHARIIRTDGEYVLVDSSLTGVFVNDIRIRGRVTLREGDTVTFGHPAGKNLLLGSHTRQPNSPFYFLFEHCDCRPDQMPSVDGDRRNSPHLLQGPDLVSAGVSSPGDPNLSLARNISHPWVTVPGVLPGRAPLTHPVAQCDHRAASAPPPNPALSASSPSTAPLPAPSQSGPEQSRVPSPSCPPLRGSRVLRSASPDYALPDNSFVTTKEDSEFGGSVSCSSSESDMGCDPPRPPRLAPQEDAGRDPGRGRTHPLLSGPTCSEVSEAADREGSPRAAETPGPWDPHSETDREEEQAEMELCPSMEETACLGEPSASEPDSPGEKMEWLLVLRERGRSHQVVCKEDLTEKAPQELDAASPSEAAVAEGVESRAVGLCPEIQASELGHVQQRDSAKGRAETCSSGEEPTSDSSTKISSQEKLDSEGRNALLPSRNSSRGTQSADVDCTVGSPPKVAASEEGEMAPPTEAGLGGLEGHLGGRELEPVMSTVIPGDTEGVRSEASVVDLGADVGMLTDGGKPGEMEVAATEPFKDMDPNQRPGADGADPKAHQAKEMPLQESPETLVLDERFKGRFFHGEKEEWSESPEATGKNLLSKDLPETPEGGGRALGADLLQGRPVRRENIVLAVAVETSVLEPPENLGEPISEQCPFQRSKIVLFENQVGEGSVTEEKSERENPRSAESSRSSSEVAADSRLQDVDERSESKDSSLGIAGVPVVGLSGGEPPSYKSGSERQCQADPKDPPSEEELELKRSIIGTSAETHEGAAYQPREAEGALEAEPGRLVEPEEAGCSAAADASLVRSLSPGPAKWSPLGSAGRKRDSSRGGLEGEKIPHLGDCSIAGTQPPSPKSCLEAGERLGSDSHHLWSCPDVTKDERFSGLNEEGRVEITVGEEEEASPVVNIPLAITKRDVEPSPMEVGSLDGPCGAFSSGSSCAEVDLQELKSDFVEPENLGNGLEVKPQGANVGRKLLCLEGPRTQDGAPEEPEAPVEQTGLPVPGEPGQDALSAEESDCFGQIAKNPRCMKAGGSTVLALPSVDLLQPGNVAVELPVGPTDDSEEALQLPDGEDGLCRQIPASEKEETDPFGPSKADGLHGRRGPSRFDPADQIANVMESREALRGPTEESATQRPGDLAIQGASAGPPKGTEMPEMSLGARTSSCRDEGPPVTAASSAAGTEPPLSRESQKAASGAPEEPGDEEMEMDPVSLAGWPEKPPWESASEPAEDGRVTCQDQGFIENTSQGLVQEGWPVAGRLPGQPDAATVASPPGEAVKELPGSEASHSPRPETGGSLQEAGMVLQDANRLPGPESMCQAGPEASTGYRAGLGFSESCKALLREEDKPHSSPRKRPQKEDLDLEDAACHPKQLCRQNSASVRGPGSDPPLPLKESMEQFGKTIERFLDQYRSRIPRCSDPTGRNGDALAQIVRNYFKSNIYSSEPATEKGRTEELEVLPSDTAAAEGIGCQSEGGAGGPGESLGCDGPRSPKGEEQGAQVPEDATVSPGGRSARSGSSAKEEDKGSVGPRQEDLYYFEEEPFPVEVGPVPGDSGSSFAAESPNAEPAEGPVEEELDTSFSWDITTSSESYEPSPSPHWSSSDPELDGHSEAEWYSPSDTDGCEEGSETPPDATLLWQEDSQGVLRDIWMDCVRPLGLSKQGALRCGEPDGGDGLAGPACREDPGEATEEKAAEGDQRGMPAEGSGFPQGVPGGSPGPDPPTESAPSEPSAQSPWESSSKPFLQPSLGLGEPPLKTELADGEAGGQDCGRSESPPPSGRAPLASALGAGNPEGGPSTPHPGPTPAEGSALVKEEPVQEDEPQPSVGAESALCPSQAGGPAGGATRPPGRDFCRPERGAGQAASQDTPWIPGTSGCFPATDTCGDQGPCRASPLQGGGSPRAWSLLADPGPPSQASQEEGSRPLPPLSHPPSPSPLFPSAGRHLHVPKTSADEQPEGPWPPADLGGREPGVPHQPEEAGLAEPSDAECLRVAAAVSECKERASLSGDPPARTESPSSSLRRSPAEWASSEQDVALQLQECQAVLAEILQALSSVEGVDNAHVEKWRDQIAVLQKATKMPQTHIAVVGNTGAGKSCLLNALLDEEALLPTSAMRACTAVVVEISRAAEGSPYEAEVEFLSQEEWNKELEALLEDMKDKAGILKKRCPDRKTEAGAAYSRVKAVYGRVDELHKLEDSQGVTQHLGTVKHISAETAADFRKKIERFIDSRTDNLREMKGGEFWPIVKCVRIRVANAEVLRTGAVLVDLPGTRDSNAARDSTAREYLKDCSAVWVAASITRAVDDKTAKELLSANFRRQLFMDGLYGSLAFVCTKTDSFSITDIVRDLNLQDKIRPLEEELQALECQRARAEAEKKHLYDQLQREEPARKGGAAADAGWLQRHDILEKEFEICALQREKEARLRAISLICVQARNEFSKRRIWMDFSAGLQEVSRRAEGEEDGEEEMDEGDSAGEQQPVHLEVFTVSSTEYLKLGGKLLCNGQPQVFHDVKDTEIPALKKFAMDTALKHSMLATEKVIRDVARVLSQMVNYLNSQRTEADAHQAQVQEVLQQALQDLPALLQRVLSTSSQDLRQAFEGLILGSLQNGAEKAKQLSEAIVKGWGSPMIGYPHVTYRAICNHHGVYTSPRYQSVDFNKELAMPILKAISVAWHEVFSSRLVGCIEGFTAALLDQLSSFFRGLQRKLHQHGPVAEALQAISAQQMEAARARLLNFTLDLLSSITRKQRTVSRLLVPTIQAGMEPAYAACSQLSGPGYFRRMKEEMERFMQQQKDSVFDPAVEKMRQQLDLVQLSIRCSLQTVAQELATSIRMQFEPLLRPVQKNKEILPELQRLCAKVDQICQRSGVEYVLPTALQPEEPPSGTEAKVPGSGGCLNFPATSMELRVGALSLPRLAAIEVSREHLTWALAGGPTKVSLPLRSISRCECCLPLGCLILHVSAKAAREVCFQGRVRLPSPGLGSQEALVIQEAAQDERQLPKLLDCLAARLSAATWVQELSPQQGREKLLSLGVSSPGQQGLESAEPPGPRVASALEPIVAVGTAEQPPPPPLIPPYGRKRVGEAVLPQLEKKPKIHPMEPAGYPWCSQGASAKPTTHPAALLGSCSPEGAFRPGSPLCPVAESPEGRPPAAPSSAGLLWVGASPGRGRKPPSITVKEEEASLPAEKTRGPRLP